MRALPLLSMVVCALACARPPDRDVRLGRLEAQRRSLEATFDRLEDRLVVNQARIRFWQEMRVRHEATPAIACASPEEAEALAIAAFAPSSTPRRSHLAAIAADAERDLAASGRSGGAR